MSKHRAFRAAILIYSLLGCLYPGLALQPAEAAQNPISATSDERDAAIQLYEKNQLPQAIAALKRVLNRTKEDYLAWYYLGLAQIKTKDLKKAAKSLQTAIELHPQFAEAHVGLAYINLLKNRPADAILEANNALSLNSTIVDAHYILAVASLRENKRDEAIKEADEVLKLNPKFAPVYLLKSQALVNFMGDAIVANTKEISDSKERYKLAADLLEQYLTLEPNGEEHEIWRDQLDAIRFYIAQHDERSGEVVFRGNQVTTKVRVLRKPEPTYTDEARYHSITGTVILRCVFSSQGVIKHILVVRALPYGLTERAITAAKKIVFVPATLNGQPASMFMQLEYNFNLY